MWKKSWIKRRNCQAEWLNGRAEGKLERTCRRRSKTEQQKEKLNGRTEEKTEIAKNLIKLGINIDDIVKATGLSKEEIEKLSKDK